MWTSSHFLNDNNSIFAKQLKILLMKKTLKSLNGKKLSSKELEIENYKLQVEANIDKK